MGCSESKSFYREVYVEMLRRLNVEPTRAPDASSTARRIAEFKRILSENGTQSLSEDNINLEMVRHYDNVHWKTTAVHRYNEELFVQAAEDVTLLNGVGVGWITSVLSVSARSPNTGSIVLHQWDYRFWLLYMCEFYRIVSVFEKAKLLKNRDWTGITVNEKELKKCIDLLINEVEIAFASDHGPGDAFRPPKSATPEAVLSQVSNFLYKNDTTKTQESTVPLLVLIRWLLLRHLNAMRTDEDNPPVNEMNNSTKGIEGDEKPPLSWHELLDEKVLELIRLYGDGSNALEELFDKWTNGTRSLSEADAIAQSYEHFKMKSLFPDIKVYEDLIGLVFRTTLKAQQSANCMDELPDSIITSVLVFDQFLSAYGEVLRLYNGVMKYDGSKRDEEYSHGVPPPSIPRGSLPRFISEEDVDYVETAIVRVLNAKRKNTQIIPFPVLADAVVMRLLGQDQRTKSVRELYDVLGLTDPMKRGFLLGLLKSHGWIDDLNPTSSFEAIQSETELGLYSTLPHLACDSAREQWVSEIINCSPEDRLGGVDSPQLMRLLHGIYGTFVAVGALGKVPLLDIEFSTEMMEELVDSKEKWSAEDEGAVEEKKEKSSPIDSLNATTPIPAAVRKEVLRKVGVSLNVPRLIQSAEETDDSSEGASCATASGLIAYISRLYVHKKQEEWRESSIKHLREVWPMDSNDKTQKDAVLRVLSKKNKRKVLIDTDSSEKDPDPIIDDLYEEYAKDLAYLVPRDTFRYICRRAARVAGGVNSGGVVIGLENLPSSSLYVLEYLEVLSIFGTGTTPTRDEVWRWFSQKFGDKVDKFAFDVLFDNYAIKDSDTIGVEALGSMCGALVAQRANLDEMLHIWVTEIREVLPVRFNAADRAIRAEMSEVVTATDGYMPIEAIKSLLIERYGIERVVPPELGEYFFIAMAQGANLALDREDLLGSEIHGTDLRFLFLFIYTYLDVYLKGVRDLRIAQNTLSGDSLALWDSPKLRSKLSTLLTSCDLGEHLDVDNLLKDKDQPWSTSRLANTLAKANVAAAVRRYVLRGRVTCDPHSLWGRLRARLPMEDTKAHRLARQKLFAYMDTGGRKLLTLSDLMRGMLGVLALNEFREDLQPILFHAFVATKEVTFDKHDVVYLTSGEEQFITAPEFSTFLYYVFTYFQMYYMFDVLCIGAAEVTKEVPCAAFHREKAILKFWGIRLDDPTKGFASINRRCREGGPLFFSGFVEWASLHHLTPEGYSHEESKDDDVE